MDYAFCFGKLQRHHGKHFYSVLNKFYINTGMSLTSFHTKSQRRCKANRGCRTFAGGSKIAGANFSRVNRRTRLLRSVGYYKPCESTS